MDSEELLNLLDFAESRVRLCASNKLTEQQKKDQLILIAEEIIELCTKDNAGDKLCR